MTTHDYSVTIMKNVGIADLKARLSEHLRYVKRGQTLTILDRDTPIARIVPVEAPEPLRIRAARGGRLQDVELPPPLHLDIDVMELLAEDRRDR